MEYGAGGLAGLEQRRPDYVIVTEPQYRKNADFDEAAALNQARQSDPILRGLFSGQAGYQLQAEFKYQLHPWLHADIVWGQNPRLLIFERLEASRPPPPGRTEPHQDYK